MLISHLLIRQNIPTCRGYLRAIVYHKSWCKLTPEEGIGMKVLKIIYIYIYIVKQSRYRHGVAQRVLGS